MYVLLLLLLLLPVISCCQLATKQKRCKSVCCPGQPAFARSQPSRCISLGRWRDDVAACLCLPSIYGIRFRCKSLRLIFMHPVPYSNHAHTIYFFAAVSAERRRRPLDVWGTAKVGSDGSKKAHRPQFHRPTQPRNCRISPGSRYRPCATECTGTCPAHRGRVGGPRQAWVVLCLVTQLATTWASSQPASQPNRCKQMRNKIQNKWKDEKRNQIEKRKKKKMKKKRNKTRHHCPVDHSRFLATEYPYVLVNLAGLHGIHAMVSSIRGPWYPCKSCTSFTVSSRTSPAFARIMPC